MLDEQAIQRACEETLRQYYVKATDMDARNPMSVLTTFMFVLGLAYGLRRAEQLCDEHHAKDHWYLTKLKQRIMDEAARVEGRDGYLPRI